MTKTEMHLASCKSCFVLKIHIVNFQHSASAAQCKWASFIFQFEIRIDMLSHVFSKIVAYCEIECRQSLINLKPYIPFKTIWTKDDTNRFCLMFYLNLPDGGSKKPHHSKT